MSVKNKVQLITYPDSLGGNLQTLNHVLVHQFQGLFKGGVHILPPFPSSGDRGFAPLTYLDIDPAFGTWEDIRTIAKHTDVMLDLMVNHLSRQSVWFQDFLKKGGKSEYADLFLTLDKIWSDGKPNPDDLKQVFLRRPSPFSTFIIEETGTQETVWTTFGKQNPSEQIDLDIHAKATRQLLTEFMAHFSRMGVKYVRLDAVGYVIKELGTSCFFVEPDIYDFLEWIKRMAASYNIVLLPEVHSSYPIQYKLAERGYWIYDFMLPYHILEALTLRSSTRLIDYLNHRPHNQFTQLDCHDGIPVKPDLDGRVSAHDARKVVEHCVEKGANLSLIVSEQHKGEDGFDVHQIRCTFYSALDCDDDAYLTARAIQFFTPGIPQVYYVGLLAGENDTEAVERTGEGREINRYNFSMNEVELAVQKPVVGRLLNLIRFRNLFPAFDGTFSAAQTSEGFDMEWKTAAAWCKLSVNLNTRQSVIMHSTQGESCITYMI